MNTKNLKGNFIKKEFPSKGVIYITKSAREQIKFLHNKIQTEWSGVLVFTILDGNLLEPAKIKIKVLGLYLMDIGNHSFTTFENVDYENLLDVIQLSDEQISNYLEDISVDQFKADVISLATKNVDREIIKQTIDKLQQLL